MNKVTFLVILLVILILSVTSCATAANHQGYDILKKELTRTQSELNTTISELQEAKKELNANTSKLRETEKELNEIKSELQTARSESDDALAQLEASQDKLAEFDSLKAQYEGLNAKYKELVKDIEEPTLDINEQEIEQVLFQLINEERLNNGLDELIWNDGLYSCARGNNINMAKTKALQTADCLSWQQVFWFLGYGTTDKIANLALAAWKNNEYSYTKSILSDSAVYGSVAVYTSEEIVYITFLDYGDIHIR